MSEARVALSRIHLREAFVMAETAELYVSHLSQFTQTDAATGKALQEASSDSLAAAYGIGGSDRQERKPFVYHDGMAIIPIHGALINRFGGCWGFITGYQYIRAMMNAALEDDDVQLIVFDVDSPGGEAAGCFELAEEMRATREIKPSLSVVDSLSCSAGYALASAATRMIATPSSRIGSIGVYRMHVDLSGALDQAGVKITMIEAPEDGMKTAGSPFAPLPDGVREEFQASVNKTYDDFVALVAANRSMIDGEIRETEARVFRADEALALGLIDAVKTPSEAVSSFIAELADDEPSGEEDEEMKTQANGITGSEATSGTPAAPAPDQTAIDAAIKADRQRMADIKALPDSAKLPKFADHLATAGYSVDEAKASLAAAVADMPSEPKAEAKADAKADDKDEGVDKTNHLAAIMDDAKHPNVGAGGDKGALASEGNEVSDEDLSAKILADQGALIGRNFGAKQEA